MRYNQLVAFYNWFEDYTRSFQLPAAEQENISLKIDHTFRVRDAMQAIACSVSLNQRDMLLAETMALFHDVGRFEQYMRYKTFKDASSTNHAALGAQILKRKQVLQGLPEAESRLITDAVALHNRPSLPADLDSRLLYFTRMLRDADKVDIFRVVTEYYDRKEQATNKTIELDLKDEPCFSDKVFRDFMEGGIILSDDMKTLNDFKLLQLAWVNDLNFAKSRQLIRENQYLGKIMDTLPEGERTRQVRRRIEALTQAPEEAFAW